MSRPGSAFHEWVESVPDDARPERAPKRWSNLSTVLDLMQKPGRWAILSPEVHINYGSRLRQAARDSGVEMETCVRGNRVYARVLGGSDE